MNFSDSYYQEIRSTGHIQWHGNSSNIHPGFPVLPPTSTTITITGETTIISQSSEHHIIPISVTPDQVTHVQPQPVSRVPVKPNSLSKVSTIFNTAGDAYTVNLLWNDDKPVSVEPRVSGGNFGIHAVGQKTTTPIFTYVQEKETSDCLDRSFNLPSDADTSRYQFDYNQETGRVTVVFPKKPSKFISLFRP
ncbi:hypothetical protein IWQ61_008730 [Dispira simplex]|nr:hypothetical protein IWQ61_008730 [Dispira simplex]